MFMKLLICVGKMVSAITGESDSETVGVNLKEKERL